MGTNFRVYISIGSGFWTLGFNWLPHSLTSDLIWFFWTFGFGFLGLLDLVFLDFLDSGFSDFGLFGFFWILELVLQTLDCDPSNQSTDITNVLFVPSKHKSTNAGFYVFMNYRLKS